MFDLIKRWFAPLLVVLAIGSALPVVAQDGYNLTQEVELVPYFNAEMQIRGVAPDWEEVQPGIFLRQRDPVDLTTLMQFGIPETEAGAVVDLLQDQFQVDQVPDDPDTIETDAFAWDVYLMETDLRNQSLIIDLAVTQDENTVYVVLLAVNETFYDQQHGDVFLPVLQAFEPLRLEAVDVYTDADETYTVPLLTDWQMAQEDGYGILTSPDDDLVIYTAAVQTDDPEAAIADVWERIDPERELTYTDDSIFQSTDPQQTNGADRIVAITYDYEVSEADQVTQAVGYTYDDTTYVLLIDTTIDAAQRYAPEINFLLQELRIEALPDAEATDESET